MNRNQTSADRSNSGNSSQAEPAREDEYFNLHVKGCGYLSRIREVQAGRGGRDSFLACSINALRGLCTDPSYTYFDLRVSGQEAEDLVREAWNDVEAQRKVFVAFRVGDIYADPYMRAEKDQRTGQLTGRQQPAAVIKGRLLQITHIQVDGVTVYVAPEPENAPPRNDDETGGQDVGRTDEDDDRHPQEGADMRDVDEQSADREDPPAPMPSPAPSPRRLTNAGDRLSPPAAGDQMRSADGRRSRDQGFRQGRRDRVAA